MSPSSLSASSEIQPPSKVLVLLLSGLGDTMMFTPALRLMRAVWKESKLVALTMHKSECDVLLHNADLNEVRMWPFTKKNNIENLQYMMQLRKEGFDLSVLPCPSNRIYYNVLSRMSGATRRAGFRYLKQSRRNLDFLNTSLLVHEDNVHNVEHNLRLVEKLSGTLRNDVQGWTANLNLPTTDQDQESALEWLQRERLLGVDCIGLHVSSSRAKHMERKCWSKENFLKLMELLDAEHENLKFILFCGDEDLTESEWLASRGGSNVHLARNLPIRTIAEILRKCSVFVTNDAGLMHVAAAIKTPTVAIFGPTNPLRTGPWMGTSTVVRTGISCSPCFYHTSHSLTCPEHIDFACLKDLSVERVLEATDHFMKTCKV
jgi:ADP-heptose:LPS heptosyltransferase